MMLAMEQADTFPIGSVAVARIAVTELSELRAVSASGGRQCESDSAPEQLVVK